MLVSDETKRILRFLYFAGIMMMGMMAFRYLTSSDSNNVFPTVSWTEFMHEMLAKGEVNKFGRCRIVSPHNRFYTTYFRSKKSSSVRSWTWRLSDFIPMQFTAAGRSPIRLSKCGFQTWISSKSSCERRKCSLEFRQTEACRSFMKELMAGKASAFDEC